MDRRYVLGFGKTGIALAIGCLILPLCHGQESSVRKEVLELNKATGKAMVLAIPLTMEPDSKATKKLLTVALAMAKEKNQPLNYNAALILGRLATDAKDLAAAEVFYRVAADQAAKLQSHTKLLESYGGLIDAFYEAKKFGEAGRICRELLDLKTDDGKERKVLRTFTDKDGDTDFFIDDSFDSAKRLRPSVLRIYIQALSKQGKYDQALKMVDELVKDKDHWIEMQLKGRVLHEAGRYEEAAKVFEDVIARVTKDTDLSAEEREEFLERYRYSLSSIFIDMNKVDQASELLQKLIDGNPKNPSYYNDLGYIWADKNVRLGEAEKLIRKALELDRDLRKVQPDFSPAEDRDNGAYLDSLGWVLFRQKSYKEAKEALLRAVEDKTAQHIEIYDHLGDACHALGDRQGAIEAWRKGLETASDSRRDQERKMAVEKKLELNK